MEISSLIVEKIARVCHETNRAYCAAIGDNTHLAWEETAQNIKDSAIAGVMSHLMNENLTGEESHALWCEFKKKDGWVYGTEKNADLKTHPCLVAYHELPIEQRVKDYLFKSSVKMSRELLGV